MSLQPFDKSAEVSAIDGEVTVLGPDHNGMSLTPEAAETTAIALLSQAARARDQGRPRTKAERQRLAAKCRDLARLAPERLHIELLRMAEEFDAETSN